MASWVISIAPSVLVTSEPIQAVGCLCRSWLGTAATHSHGHDCTDRSRAYSILSLWKGGTSSLSSGYICLFDIAIAVWCTLQLLSGLPPAHVVINCCQTQHTTRCHGGGKWQAMSQTWFKVIENWKLIIQAQLLWVKPIEFWERLPEKTTGAWKAACSAWIRSTGLGGSEGHPLGSDHAWNEWHSSL